MKLKPLVSAIASLAIASGAIADTKVESAWVRASVPHQPGTGAFMKIVSSDGGRLIAASSPISKSTEIHNMVMVGDVMKMRPIDHLDLPAGQPVELKPGSYHVMFTDLKEPAKAGEQVPITLTIEHAGGRKETVEVMAPVMPLNAMPGHHGASMPH